MKRIFELTFRTGPLAILGIAALAFASPALAQDAASTDQAAAAVASDLTAPQADAQLLQPAVIDEPSPWYCEGSDCSPPPDTDSGGCYGDDCPPVIDPGPPTCDSKVCPPSPPTTPPQEPRQSTPDCGKNCGSPTATQSSSEPTSGIVALNSGNTDTIVKMLADANRTCGTVILRKYRVDCLRIYYLRTAQSLPDRGEYRPIKVALQRAADQLDQIVTANADPTAPTIRPRERNRAAAPRMPALRAVTAKSENAVIAQAEKVVADTSMLILRSGGDPKRRSAHYQEIVAAVDSNILLLRSA